LLTQHQRHQAASRRIAEEIGALLSALEGAEAEVDPSLAERFARLESQARATLPVAVPGLARAIRFLAEARVAAGARAPARARQLLLVARDLTSDFGRGARESGAPDAGAA
jgi:hypothetical protein